MALRLCEQQADGRQPLMHGNPVEDGRDDADRQKQLGPQVFGGNGQALEDRFKRDATPGQHHRQLRQRADALQELGRSYRHVSYVITRHNQVKSEIANWSLVQPDT